MQHQSNRALARVLALGAALAVCAGVTAPTARATTSGPNSWLTVDLGTHRYGRLAEPDGTVARARPGQVAFIPGREAAPQDPSTFQVLADGSVWLLDTGNARALVWSAGHPWTVARTVAVPSAGTEDFAVAADGTIYTTSLVGGPVQLYALEPDGKQRWHAPLAELSLGHPLRFGPDGVLYRTDVNGSWTPLITRAGTPLTPTQQATGTLEWQPVTGGRRLVSTMVSQHDYRFVLQASDGAWLRGWRLTSRTAFGGIVEPPSLIGDDLVVVLAAGAPDSAGTRPEYQVVRVTPGGTVVANLALSADTAWGDVLTAVRAGPDASVYALQSDPSTGARIVRYSLAATTSTPPAGSSSPTVTSPAATPPATPTGTAPAQASGPAVTVTPAAPGDTGSSTGPLGWAVGAFAAAAALAGAGWYWFRHTHY